MKGVCSYFCCGACARNAGSEPAGCVRYLSDVTRRGMLPHRTYQEATPSVFFKFTHRTDASSRPLLSRHSPHRRRAESTMPSELHVQLQSSEMRSALHKVTRTTELPKPGPGSLYRSQTLARTFLIIPEISGTLYRRPFLNRSRQHDNSWEAARHFWNVPNYAVYRNYAVVE